MKIGGVPSHANPLRPQHPQPHPQNPTPETLDNFTPTPPPQSSPKTPTPAPQTPASPSAPAQQPAYSSGDDLTQNTIGWSGEPSHQAPIQQTHRQQIQRGIELMEQILPGMQARMDQYLHQSDPQLQGQLDAIVAEQSQLFSSQGQLLSTPDERLSPQQLQKKSQLNALIEAQVLRYEAVEKQLESKKSSNRERARELADTFLHRLRQRGPSPDVSDRIRLDPTASQRLQQNGTSLDTFHHWVNEFHHQTGLPAPHQLKFRYYQDRPDYQSQLDSVNIGKHVDKRLILHEVAHRAEYKYPEISLANKSWVQARCRNGGFSDEPARLSQLASKDSYKDDEVAMEDSFINPYVGKLYPDMATEVLSMGLEHFANEKLFTNLYQRDPEHLMLTLGAIQVLQSKSDW